MNIGKKKLELIVRRLNMRYMEVLKGSNYRYFELIHNSTMDNPYRLTLRAETLSRCFINIGCRLKGNQMYYFIQGLMLSDLPFTLYKKIDLEGN